MTCASCRFSEFRQRKSGEVVLWCVLYRREACRRCAEFEYEPGTDEKAR